jgi:hypothetical protein
MWRNLYQSPWQHPGLAFLFGGISILLVVALRPFHSRAARGALPITLLFALFQFEILLDAALTGALTPLSGNGALATLLPVLFVVLGDLRYFYLVERQRQDVERSRPHTLIIATAFAVTVTLLMGAGQLLFPGYFVGNRLFLTYELTFLFLATGHYFLRADSLSESLYVRRLFTFEVVQYWLWVTADILILCGIDFGWGLRIVPNLFYYVGFAPFAILAAPEEART